MSWLAAGEGVFVVLVGAIGKPKREIYIPVPPVTEPVSVPAPAEPIAPPAPEPVPAGV
jgi:hypothetical protein